MKEKGFTLIEMLIVMIVISIITTVVLVEYRSGEKTNTLQLAAQQAVNDLKEAQNLSLSAQKSNGDIPRGGFGVSFPVSPDNVSYILFADEDADKRYDDTGEEIRTVELPEGIEISSIHGANNPLDVVFLPPNSDVFFSGIDSFYWEIDFRIIGTSITKTITIYDRGAIEVD
jgi:prepilin-type N-terminal cleavage/methylation domain-containing protein